MPPREGGGYKHAWHDEGGLQEGTTAGYLLGGCPKYASQRTFMYARAESIRREGMVEESERPQEYRSRMIGPWGMGRGIRGRIALSIIAFLGLIIFVIVWLFFFAIDLNVYQNIAIIIIGFLVFFGIEAAMWATMWMKWGRVW